MNRDWLVLHKDNIPADLLKGKYEVEFYFTGEDKWTPSSTFFENLVENVKNRKLAYRYRLKESPIKKKIVVAITWDKQKRTIGNITSFVSSNATIKTPIKRDGEILEEFLVTAIEEHSCGVEGDKWYWDIHISDNSTLRIFNPEEVLYAEEEKIDE